MGPTNQETSFMGWICFCLLPLLLTIPERVGCDEKFEYLFSTASCEFAIDLLKSQTDLTEGNVVVSPISVGILLSILQQGAQENTLKQLETVLHITAEQSKIGQSFILKSLQREKVNVTLEWGNRAYIRPGFEIVDDFNATIQENFGAAIQELSFVEPSPEAAAAAINTWIEEITHGKIKSLISPSLLTPTTTFILLNAIYFKGLWDVPFKKTLTKKEEFETSFNHSVSASFMSQEERFIAGEDMESGVQWVDLPFKDEQFSMLFLLPTEKHSLNKVLENISGSLLRNIIDDDQTRLVTLSIPKFKLQEKVSLAEPLRKLGLTDIFTEEANLGRITPSSEHLNVTKILHEASVEIDETGSTASAATGISLEVLSFPKSRDHLNFKADHPFLFFILDRRNKIPLFAGKVINPRKLLPINEMPKPEPRIAHIIKKSDFLDAAIGHFMKRAVLRSDFACLSPSTNFQEKDVFPDSLEWNHLVFTLI